MYTPLTRQQYDEAIKAGFSGQQIIEMEKKRKILNSQVAKEEKESTGFFGGLAGLVGGKELAIGGAKAISSLSNDPREMAFKNADIATSLIKEAKKFSQGSKRRTELLQQANHIAGLSSEMSRQFLESIPSSKQVIGSGIQLGATIGALGLPAAGAKTALGRIAQTSGELGGLGAIAGGAEALKQDTSILGGALAGGATGAVLGGVGGAISELASYLTSPGVTEGLYNKMIGVPKKVIEKGRSPSGMLIKEGIGGTKAGILKKSQVIASDSETQISNILSNNSTRVNSGEVINRIQSELQEKFQNSLTAEEIKTIIDKLPINVLRANRDVPIKTLNALRKELDNNFLGSAKWLSDSSVERTMALKTATNIMRDIVQGVDERLPSIFSRWSNAITAVRSLRADLAKPHMMTNLLEIFGSLIYGGTTGGLNIEGLKKSLGAFAVVKGVTSAPVGTGLARGLSKLGQTGIGPMGTFAKTIVPGISKSTVSK